MYQAHGSGRDHDPEGRRFTVVTDHLTAHYTVVRYGRRGHVGYVAHPRRSAHELLCFNDQQPAGHGPPRVTQNEVTTSRAHG